MISIKNLYKSYIDNSTEQVVFQDLSYRFESQGVYSVAGSSGSGKTTLLNLISGLDVYNKGTIVVDDKTIESLSVEEKSILRKDYFGFGYQFHYLLENLTVFENCLAACHGTENEYIYDIMKKLGIDHIKNKFPSNISGVKNKEHL